MENPKSRLIERILNFRRKKHTAAFLGKPSPRARPQVDPESLKKGTDFESFVVRRFDPDEFTLIEWRSDKTVEGIFPLMSKFPDLEFYFTSDQCQLQFAIECKWRAHFYKECLQLDKFNLEDYRHYEQVTGYPTFIVVGIGNTPTNPQNVYVIPLKDITQEKIHEFDLEVFKRGRPHNNFRVNHVTKKIS